MKATKKELYDALALAYELFIHIEGDTKGNKIKTKIIAECPDVRDKLNVIQNILCYKTNYSN